MYCKSCGAVLTEEMKVCPACGVPVQNAEPETEQPMVAEHASDRSGIPDGLTAEETVIKDREDSRSGRVICLECGAANPEGSEYCQGCGAKLQTQNGSTGMTGQERDGNWAAKSQALVCPSCGTQNTPESLFCQNCGYDLKMAGTVHPIEKTEPAQNPDGIYCPGCGTLNQPDNQFCSSCGSALKRQKPVWQHVRKKGTGKKGTFAIAAAGVLAVVLLVCFIAGGLSSSGSDYYYYVKDNELIRAGYGVKKTEVIDDGIFDGGYYFFSGEWLNVEESKDGKVLYYSGRYDTDDYTFSLYGKQAGKKKDPVKLASDVDWFRMLPSGQILYQSSDALYLTDIRDNKEKLASDCVRAEWSGDGKQLLWLSRDEGKLYTLKIDGKSEKEKLDTDVTELVECADDLSVIVYRKDDAVYVIRNLKDKEKVAEDASVVSIGSIDKNYQIVYLRKQNDVAQYSLMDFIKDDLADEDQSIREPNIMAYQTEQEVESFWGTRRETVTDETYYEELEKYNEKLQRDSLRSSLAEYTLDAGPLYDLICYDGTTGENTVLRDSIRVGSDMLTEDDKYDRKDSIVCFSYASMDEIPQIRLSELLVRSSHIDDIGYMIKNELRDYPNVLLLIQENVREWNELDMRIEQLVRDEQAGKLYVRAVEKDAENADKLLFCVDYNTKKGGPFEELDEDVDRILGAEGGKVYYLKDMDSHDAGDLYCSGQKITSDVFGGYDASGECFRVAEDGNVLFYTDRNGDGIGTLMLYDGKKVKKVGSDVTDYLYHNEEEILMLSDYNRDRCRGELCVYNGKEVKTLDSDVAFFAESRQEE